MRFLLSSMDLLMSYAVTILMDAWFHAHANNFYVNSKDAIQDLY